MAGTGPTRKHPSVRARRNTVSTAATLTEQNPDDVEIPKLPSGVTWHSMTKAWWNDIWPSPMAQEWHSSDIHGLYRLAMMVNTFWQATDETVDEDGKDIGCDMATMLKMATEIRLSGQPYGLTPLDRRRLEWQIEETDAKKAAGNRRRAAGQQTPAPTPVPGADPRLHLVASNDD